MNQRYKEALSEVEFVLERLGSEEMTKIPKTFQEFISENKCKWHEITEDDELKEETLAILAIIYRKFLAPPEERERLEKEYLEKLKKEKEEANKKSRRNIKELSFQDINLKEYIIIDVRSRREFGEHHLDNSINIPLLEIKKTIEKIVKDKQRKILICCEYGVRSKQAAETLENLGYTQVYNLKGGLENI